MDEPELGRLLSDAVPQPLAPPDRLAQIARRVRRRHRIAVAGAGAAVAMVAAAGVSIAALIGQGDGGSPAEPAPAVVVGPDGCPPVTATAPTNQPDADRAGRLVPDNPTEVVMCEKPAGNMPTWEPEPIAQRRLTDGAADFAALLNRARTAQAQRAADRQSAARQGINPDRVGPGCSAAGNVTVISFVLHYSGGKVVAVLLDQNCASLYANGRTRFYGGLFRPVDEFLRRYRDVLATVDPATIATPVCAETIAPQRLNRRQLPSGPGDDVARNRRSLANGLLPNAVVAVAACRYTVTANGAQLATGRSSRTPGGLREIINRQVTTQSAAPDACGQPDGPPPTRLDVVTVVDATGASLEVWVYRAPCAAVVATGVNGATPDPEILSFVDGLLGPPR
jgi:hypothetical protein